MTAEQKTTTLKLAKRLGLDIPKALEAFHTLDGWRSYYGGMRSYFRIRAEHAITKELIDRLIVMIEARVAERDAAQADAAYRRALRGDDGRTKYASVSAAQCEALEDGQLLEWLRLERVLAPKESTE